MVTATLWITVCCVYCGYSVFVFDMDYYGDWSLSSADLVMDLSGQSDGVAPPATPPVCVGGPATPPPPGPAPQPLPGPAFPWLPGPVYAPPVVSAPAQPAYFPGPGQLYAAQMFGARAAGLRVSAPGAAATRLTSASCYGVGQMPPPINPGNLQLGPPRMSLAQGFPAGLDAQDLLTRRAHLDLALASLVSI